MGILFKEEKMTDILLSIKPEFVARIFSGDKKFEFRKVIPTAQVDKIYIYATRPICAVVGYATVSGIISDNPDILWNKTDKYAGIARDFFDFYFSGRARAHAYCLENVIKYNVPRSLSEFGISAAPQNFIYIKN